MNTSKTGPRDEKQAVCPPCTAQLPDRAEAALLKFMGSSNRKSLDRKGAAKNLLTHKMQMPNSFSIGTQVLQRCMQARLSVQSRAYKANPQPFLSSLTPEPTREQAEKTLGGRSQFQSPEIVFILRESKHSMPLRSKASSTRKVSCSADARGIRVR